jgi:hypothetical protein
LSACCQVMCQESAPMLRSAMHSASVAEEEETRKRQGSGNSLAKDARITGGSPRRHRGFLASCGQGPCWTIACVDGS